MEHFGIEQESQEIKNKEESSSYNKILSMYRFSCVFPLLDMACMVLHVVIFYHGMGFARCDSVFSLALPFPDNHGVVEFSCFGLVGLMNGFKLSGVDLRIDITHGLVTLEPDSGLQ